MNQQERITIQMIEDKRFAEAPRGYDREEVDDFLDSICDEIELMQNEMADLEEQLRQARLTRPVPVVMPEVPATPAPAPVVNDNKAREQEILEMLRMATRLKDEKIAEAEAQASEIIAQAHDQADAETANLAAQKEKLTEEVEQLKSTAREYRIKFEALLQAQQSAMDKISDLF